jgi:hypothetical protein
LERFRHRAEKELVSGQAKIAARVSLVPATSLKHLIRQVQTPMQVMLKHLPKIIQSRGTHLPRRPSSSIGSLDEFSNMGRLNVVKIQGFTNQWIAGNLGHVALGSHARKDHQNTIEVLKSRL